MRRPRSPANTASQEERSVAFRSKGVRPKDTTRHWRRDVRPRILRSAVIAADSLPWSATLLEALFEELYVADDVEALIGPVDGLPVSHYAQAIALALILRHSWRADDLAAIVERLGLSVPLR